MMKKIGIASVVVLAGLVLLATTNLGSYARTGWNKIKKHAGNSVPLEFELERVRGEVDQLVPDMNKNINAIAHEMVAIDNLRKDIEQTRANLDAQKKNILTMREDVEGKGDREVIFYDGSPYKAERVKTKLARDWEAYKQGEASLKAKEELLEAKEQSLAAAKEQMNAMKAKKEHLEVEIAQLEAQLKTLRVSEARGSFKIDDSRLGRIEDSLKDIRNRINVASTEASLRGEYNSDVIPVEKKVQTADVLKDIDSHFAKDKELANKK
jgi:chromosome segregation ATPase